VRDGSTPRARPRYLARRRRHPARLRGPRDRSSLLFVEKVEEIAQGAQGVIRDATFIPRPWRGQHRAVRPRSRMRSRYCCPPGRRVTIAVPTAVHGARAPREPQPAHLPGTSGDLGGFFNPRDRTELAAFCAPCPAGCRSTSSASAATCWCVTGGTQGDRISTHGTLDCPHARRRDHGAGAEDVCRCASIARQ